MSKTTTTTTAKKTSTKKKAYTAPALTKGKILGRDDFSEEDYQQFVRTSTYDAKASPIQVRIGGVLASLSNDPKIPAPVQTLAREANPVHIEAVLKEDFDDPNELSDADLGLYTLSAAREVREEGTAYADGLVAKHSTAKSLA